MPQKKVHAQASQTVEQAAEEPLELAQTGEAMETDDLDAVLDDIESTLQTNAEEYVSSFVQKGGE